jgi:predicted PurR-regulated permease PerM
MFKLFKNSGGEELEIKVANQTVLRVIGIVFGAILFLAAVKQAQHALILIFTAFFLSLALNAPVQWIARHLPGKFNGKRTTATAISFLLVVVLLGAFLASIVPPLVKQSQSFVTAAPHLVEDTRNGNGPLGQFINRYGLEGQVDEASKEIGSRLKGAAGGAVSSLGKIGSSIFSVLTILVLTFMMLIDGPRSLRFFRELVPARKRDDADRLSMEMYQVVKGYINGQVTLAALAALVISPLFFILGISYPIALTVIVFICGLIPMVGHTIGAVIVTLVALATSPVSALIVLSYYILYQQIENYLIQPRIQANSTNMSPLLVFISVIVGVSFGGLFGGLFAIPVAGCIRILFLDYLRNHELITTDDKPTVKAELAKAGTKAA